MLADLIPDGIANDRPERGGDNDTPDIQVARASIRRAQEQQRFTRYRHTHTLNHHAKRNGKIAVGCQEVLEELLHHVLAVLPVWTDLNTTMKARAVPTLTSCGANGTLLDQPTARFDVARARFKRDAPAHSRVYASAYVLSNVVGDARIGTRNALLLLAIHDKLTPRLDARIRFARRIYLAQRGRTTADQPQRIRCP